MRTQAQYATAKPSAASMVMCSPEMLIRCPTPVRQKTSQSAAGIASWSPIASATSTPRSAASPR